MRFLPLGRRSGPKRRPSGFTVRRTLPVLERASTDGRPVAKKTPAEARPASRCPVAVCARCGYEFPGSALAGTCPRCLEPFTREACYGGCFSCPLA